MENTIKNNENKDLIESLNTIFSNSIKNNIEINNNGYIKKEKEEKYTRISSIIVMIILGLFILSTIILNINFYTGGMRIEYSIFFNLVEDNKFLFFLFKLYNYCLGVIFLIILLIFIYSFRYAYTIYKNTKK